MTATRGDKLNEWKQKFARTDGTPECPTLLAAIKHAKPNALFGLTGAGPSWNQEVRPAPLLSPPPSLRTPGGPPEGRHQPR